MEQCLMKSTATNKTKKVRVIPGYHLTLGITVTMLSLIVLIPLASVMVSALKLRPAEFWSLITKPTVRHAFATSIGCSFIAALINSVFGVIIAWVLVRYEFPGKRILDGCIELPFALPTSVAGITLSKMYSENGILGTPLAKLGIKVSYTHLGLVIALVFPTERKLCQKPCRHDSEKRIDNYRDHSCKQCNQKSRTHIFGCDRLQIKSKSFFQCTEENRKQGKNQHNKYEKNADGY